MCSAVLTVPGMVGAVLVTVVLVTVVLVAVVLVMNAFGVLILVMDADHGAGGIAKVAHAGHRSRPIPRASRDGSATRRRRSRVIE
jgi:hypothetical protein